MLYKSFCFISSHVRLLLEEIGPSTWSRKKNFRDTRMGGVLSASGRIYYSEK